MKNWKTNLLFILGIGIIGHKVGNQLEYLSGMTSNPTIIENINFCQQETELAINTIQEAESLISKAIKETDLTKQRTLIFEAEYKYYLAKTQIDIVIDSLKAVAPFQGEALKLHNEDIEQLQWMETMIDKNIEKIGEYRKDPNIGLTIQNIEVTKGDLKTKRRIFNFD